MASRPEKRQTPFSKDGVTKVVADPQIVGSYSTYSHTWMWSWANKYVDEGMKRDIGKVKEFGERHNYKGLFCRLICR